MTKIFTLRNLVRVGSIIALLATSYRLFLSLQQIFIDHQVDRFEQITLLARLFTDIGLAMMAVFLSFKGKLQKGGQLFALFLVGLVLNDVWFYQGFTKNISALVLSLESALTATLFVSAFQFFPNQITSQQIKRYIKIAPLRVLMDKLLKGNSLWFFFLPIVFILTATFNLLSLKLPMVALNLVIILTGFAYMYINYKKAGIDSRSSILWLFWGVLCHIILVLFSTMLNLFNPADNTLITLVVAIARNLVLLVMVFMSVFFASSFDTGFIIKRTIVDGALFLFVILIYNVVEHYLLHTINHTLHINDVFISSLFSGIMVLVISPLHHKLITYLNKKLKSGSDNHAH